VNPADNKGQHIKPTYTPVEAAKFLGITLLRLAQLTASGTIRMQRHRKQNFYLGGELDSARSALQHERKSFLTGR
jgi:hypothetical protein